MRSSPSSATYCALQLWKSEPSGTQHNRILLAAPSFQLTDICRYDVVDGVTATTICTLHDVDTAAAAGSVSLGLSTGTVISGSSELESRCITTRSNQTAGRRGARLSQTRTRVLPRPAQRSWGRRTGQSVSFARLGTVSPSIP